MGTTGMKERTNLLAFHWMRRVSHRVYSQNKEFLVTVQFRTWENGKPSKKQISIENSWCLFGGGGGEGRKSPELWSCKIPSKGTLRQTQQIPMSRRRNVVMFLASRGDGLLYYPTWGFDIRLKLSYSYRQETLCITNNDVGCLEC